MAGQPTKRCPSPLHIGTRELPIEEFHLRKDAKSGRKSWCRFCISTKYRLDPSNQKARSTRWYAKNGEAFKKRQNELYRTDPVIRARRKVSGARWAKENPDLARQKNREWVARNRDKVNESSRRSQRQRRDYYRASLILYQARKKANGGNVTKAKLAARWAYFAGKCWMCGEAAIAWDHVKPVSKGGGSWASNLRPACKSCNSSKSNKWPF